MPVSGEIIQVNKVLATDIQEILLKYAEPDGWIQYMLTIRRKM